MGTKVSSLLDVSNSVLNKSVTNVLQQNTNNITYNIKAGQTASFIVDTSDVKCTDSGVLIGQQLTGNVTIAANITQETTNQLQNLFTNTLANDVSQTQKVLQQLFGGIGANIEQSAKIQNAIKSEIQNTITQNNVNNIVNNIANDQSGNVLIKNSTYIGPCSVKQNMALQIQASNIIGNLMKSIASNEAVTSVTNELQQKQDVELEGLAGVIKSIGDAVSGILLSAIAPLIIIAVVIVVLFPSIIGGATKSWKTFFIVFFILLIIAVIVFCALYFTKTPPFKEQKKYPDDVVKKECQDEYDAAQEVKVKYDKAKDESEKKSILVESRQTVDGYNTCMGKKSVLATNTTENFTLTPEIVNRFNYIYHH
jgi:hypothetical protein